jgi:hypothetical protein
MSSSITRPARAASPPVTLGHFLAQRHLDIESLGLEEILLIVGGVRIRLGQ